MPLVRVRLPARQHQYEIKIGPDLLSELGREARAIVGPKARRIAVISNPTIFDLFGKQVNKSLRGAGFIPASWLMKDGERYKSLRSLERVLAFLSKTRLESADALVAPAGTLVGVLACDPPPP